MATGMYSWSQTAASNNSADSTINWAEGQAPSSINDSARASMAVLAKWRDDISGVTTSNNVLTTGGTANAQTLSTNGSIAALTNGWTVTFKAGATNTGACTLAVDSLTAKNIQKISGTNLVGGEILTGQCYTVTYHQPADAWVMRDSVPAASTAQVLAETGVDVHIRPDRLNSSERVAKAWAHVTESATTYTIQDSVNVTSVTRNSTGSITVNFTNAIGNATFAAIATAHNAGSMASVSNHATGSVRVNIRTDEGNADDNGFNVIVFGAP